MPRILQLTTLNCILAEDGRRDEFYCWIRPYHAEDGHSGDAVRRPEGGVWKISGGQTLDLSETLYEIPDGQKLALHIQFKEEDVPPLMRDFTLFLSSLTHTDLPDTLDDFLGEVFLLIDADGKVTWTAGFGAALLDDENDRRVTFRLLDDEMYDYRVGLAVS